MDAGLAAIMAEYGVFLTREAHQLGWSDRAIAAAVRHGLWHRGRRGAFVSTEQWRASGPEQRHLIKAAAVRRSYGDRIVFSHTTAALMHGISVWGLNLDRIHITRRDLGSGRLESDLVHHQAFLTDPDDVVRLGRSLVTAPTRAALETGILGTAEQALVILDSALNRALTTPTELGNVYDVTQRWPWAQHLQISIRMMDARAQSPGESRCRWLFYIQGIPAPDLQYEVRDEHGHLVGISDFRWRAQRMLGEFDGRAKYARLLNPGQTPADAVFAEKVREDAMRRAAASGMLRLIWPELDRPAVTGTRVRRILNQAA